MWVVAVRKSRMNAAGCYVCHEIELMFSVRCSLCCVCDFIHSKRCYAAHKGSNISHSVNLTGLCDCNITFAKCMLSFSSSLGLVLKSFWSMWFPGLASLSLWCVWPPALPPFAARGHRGILIIAPSTATCGLTCCSLNCSSLLVPIRLNI